jgi:hypothetical protein
MTTRLGFSAVLFVAAMMVGIASVAAEDFVVIESTGAPKIAEGSMLSGGQTVTVPEKGRVVLAGDSGRMVTLAGPFSGPVAQPGPAGDGRVLTALASLVRKKETDQSAVGAVRNADVTWRKETATSLADVVAIDTGDGGDTCLYDPTKAELLRAPTDAAPRVNILNATSGAGAMVEWGAARRAPWPKALPIEDGESYVFEQPGKATAAVVTVHVLPNQAASDIGRVAQLADAGCDGQARLLLAVIAKPAK